MKKILLALSILFASCKNSINTDVEAAMQQYDSLLLHVDAKGIAGMFTNNGELAEPGGITIHGRDSIENFLAQFIDVKVEEQKSTTDSIRKVDDTAFQYGKYYQRAIINNIKAEVHGMFQANWVIQPDGKLLLQRMSAWPANNQ